MVLRGEAQKEQGFDTKTHENKTQNQKREPQTQNNCQSSALFNVFLGISIQYDAESDR